MKKVLILGLLSGLVSLAVSCHPFKKLNSRLDRLEGKIDQNHKEVMGTLVKNHQEAMKAIAEINEAIKNNKKELAELAEKVDSIVNQGYIVSGQIKPRVTVHVREGPSVRYKSSGYLKGGEAVKIDHVERTWVRIKEGKWQGKWCTMLYMQLSVESLTQAQ